jgi:hypothetical protein
MDLCGSRGIAAPVYRRPAMYRPHNGLAWVNIERRGGYAVRFINAMGTVKGRAMRPHTRAFVIFVVVAAVVLVVLGFIIRSWLLKSAASAAGPLSSSQPTGHSTHPNTSGSVAVCSHPTAEAAPERSPRRRGSL